METCTTVEEPKRLTDAQRDLAAKWVHLVEIHSLKFIRRRPQEEESIRSSGMLGLCEAARTFDPTVSKFTTHAKARIVGQILDDIRMTNAKGFRRDWENAPDVISTESLIAGFDERNLKIDYASLIPSDEEPTSANLEYQDMLAAFAKGLPANVGPIFKAYHGEAGRKLKEAARASGVSESRGSQAIAQSIEMIRDRIQNDHKDRLGLSHYARTEVTR